MCPNNKFAMWKQPTGTIVMVFDSKLHLPQICLLFCCCAFGITNIKTTETCPNMVLLSLDPRPAIIKHCCGISEFALYVQCFCCCSNAFGLICVKQATAREFLTRRNCPVRVQDHPGTTPAPPRHHPGTTSARIRETHDVKLSSAR